ncbi:MAG: YjbF family lipoprotein [Sulfitobacter sp.]
MKSLSISLILISSLALAACSGGNGKTKGNGGALLQAGTSVLGAVKARRASKNNVPTRIVVTRKLLDETVGEVMQVIPDKTGLQDFMFLVGKRNDSYPGTVEVWKSSDNVHLILRDGVLIATKGLGGDMRSADASTAIAGFDGHGGGGERVMVLDRQDGSAQAVPFACDMTQLGRETIQIVDQRISTYRMREDCVYRNTKITNEYWVETSGGRMRKSRQWAGPVFGYVAFERLKN